MTTEEKKEKVVDIERTNNLKTRFELVYEALTTPDANGNVYSSEMAASLTNTLLIWTASTHEEQRNAYYSASIGNCSSLTSRIDKLKKKLHQLSQISEIKRISTEINNCLTDNLKNTDMDEDYKGALRMNIRCLELIHSIERDFHLLSLDKDELINYYNELLEKNASKDIHTDKRQE